MTRQDVTFLARVRTRLAALALSRFHLALLVLSLAAGVAVFLVATRVFPYHSINHDEAVYLQQAAMLLDGQLFLRPPVPEAFRPWFFVADGGALYPKYTPLPAAVFAVGMALGDAHLSLAAVGAAVVALSGLVVREAFDARTGLLAAAFVAASPLFLIDTALFLPYAPTTALNLLFAYAYLRADRHAGTDGSEAATGRRWAALAGAAVGLAFFARPYTAVLFAAPFVVHALWTVRGDGTVGPVGGVDPAAVSRQATTAVLGLGGVALALGYNALVTGDPFVFPYQAFAPLDGLGFGHRRILGYERDYTPALALQSNAIAASRLFGEWVVAGVAGTVLAAVGLVAVLRRGRDVDPRKLVLAGLFVTVLVGNVAFWGTLNVLGDLGDPTDGLVRYLGTYYHFDLLVPTAAFAAHGARQVVAVGWSLPDRLVESDIVSSDRRRQARVVVAVLLLVGGSAFGAAAVGAVVDPVRDDARVSDQLAAAYEPFADHRFTNALVFLPTPYGDWLGHPFQSLRNDPGYDGRVVYALRERQFAVVDAFPDRTLYRYSYRGEWEPYAGEAVEPRLQRIRHRRGERVTMAATLGLPDATESVSVRLGGDGGSAYAVGNATDGELDVRVVVTNGTARLAGDVRPVGNATVPVDGSGTLRVTAFVEYGAGSGFEYRLELPVARDDGAVRALTPYAEACHVPRRCGGEATYVPDAAGEGVSVETDLLVGTASTATNGSETR